MKKIVSLLTCLILIFTMSQGLVSCTQNDATGPDHNAQNYEKALVCLANGEYEAAKEIFEKLGDYRDSAEYLSKFYYMPANFVYDLIGKKGSDEVSYDDRNLPKSQAIMRPDAQAIYNYIYDENGNMIKQVVTMNTDDGHVVSIYEYTYDAKNQRIRAEFEMYNGVTGYHAFTYDEDGNLIKQAYEDSQGNSYECFMSYDEKGNKIRSENVSGGVSEVINISYQFDDKGRAIKETWTYPGDFGESSDYTYDANGNKLSEVFTAWDGDQCRYDYTYDENGNVLKEEFTGYDGIKEHVIIEYELKYIPCGITVGTEAFFVEIWAGRL